MRVVVTGGAGFIGATLCRLLADTPEVEEVVAFDDLSTGFLANLDDVDGTRLIAGSILDRELLGRVVQGADAVVHLAARPSVPLALADPVASHHVNITGTVNVLEAARKVGAHVIVASSSAVYGDVHESPKHEWLPTRPLSPYGVTKVATEQYAVAYAHSFGLPTLALRFFNVYGPLQPSGHAYASVVPAFVSAALAGRRLQIFGDGRQVRDFVFVDTVAAVLRDATLRRVISPVPANLATGTRTDLLTLVSELEGVLGHDLEIEHLQERVGDIRDSQSDQSTFRKLFPDIVPVELGAGLRATVEWFRSQPE